MFWNLPTFTRPPPPPQGPPPQCVHLWSRMTKVPSYFLRESQMTEETLDWILNFGFCISNFGFWILVNVDDEDNNNPDWILQQTIKIFLFIYCSLWLCFSSFSVFLSSLFFFVLSVFIVFSLPVSYFLIISNIIIISHRIKQQSGLAPSTNVQVFLSHFSICFSTFSLFLCSLSISCFLSSFL